MARVKQSCKVRTVLNGDLSVVRARRHAATNAAVTTDPHRKNNPGGWVNRGLVVHRLVTKLRAKGQAPLITLPTSSTDYASSSSTEPVLTSSTATVSNQPPAPIPTSQRKNNTGSWVDRGLLVHRLVTKLRVKAKAKQAKAPHVTVSSSCAWTDGEDEIQQPELEAATRATEESDSVYLADDADFEAADEQQSFESLGNWTMSVTNEYEEPEPEYEAFYNAVAGDTEDDTE